MSLIYVSKGCNVGTYCNINIKVSILYQNEKSLQYHLAMNMMVISVSIGLSVRLVEVSTRWCDLHVYIVKIRRPSALG